MATRTGLDASVGFVKESTYNTIPIVIPNRWMEFNKESIKRKTARIASGGIRAGKFNTARSGMYSTHQQGAQGQIELEIQRKGMAFFLEHMLGTVATVELVAATAYSHTGSIGSLAGKSFGAQVGRPNIIDGAVHPFSYTGGKILGWGVKCAVGEVGMLTLDCDFSNEDNAPGLAAPVLPASQGILTFVEGKLTVAAAEMKVTAASFDATNGLSADRFFTGGTKREPLDGGRGYTGSIEAEFESLTAYNRFVNATEVSVDLLFEGPVISGAHKWTWQVTYPVCRFDGETPVVDSMEEIKQPLPIVGLDDAITVFVKNSDTTA